MSLSDGLAIMSNEIENADRLDRHSICLMLQLFGMEARNMEARLEWLAGRPHTPLLRGPQTAGGR